jgi:hypothetical protein
MIRCAKFEYQQLAARVSIVFGMHARFNLYALPGVGLFRRQHARTFFAGLRKVVCPDRNPIRKLKARKASPQSFLPLKLVQIEGSQPEACELLRSNLLRSVYHEDTGIRTVKGLAASAQLHDHRQDLTQVMVRLNLPQSRPLSGNSRTSWRSKACDNVVLVVSMSGMF